MTLVLFVIVTIITKSISCFSGLIMYAKYFDCDPLTTGQIKRPDQILPYYVMDVASQIPGLGGLFIAGIFSTALSTLSTYLNSLSGTICTDFVFPFTSKETSEKRASNIIKVTTVIIGAISVALAFVVEKLGSIIEIWISLNGITNGPVIGLFTLGMVFPVANSKGAVYGGVASLLFMSWMIINTKLYVTSGNIKYKPKPLYSYGCNGTGTWFSGYNSTLPDENVTYTTITKSSCEDEPFWWFRVTFHYYALIGALLTVIIGLGISWLTKTDVPEVKSNLLSPCINRLLKYVGKKTQYEAVEKKLSSTEEKNER